MERVRISGAARWLPLRCEAQGGAGLSSRRARTYGSSVASPCWISGPYDLYRCTRIVACCATSPVTQRRVLGDYSGTARLVISGSSSPQTAADRMPFASAEDLACAALSLATEISEE